MDMEPRGQDGGRSIGHEGGLLALMGWGVEPMDANKEKGGACTHGGGTYVPI